MNPCIGSRAEGLPHPFPRNLPPVGSVGRDRTGNGDVIGFAHAEQFVQPVSGNRAAQIHVFILPTEPPVRPDCAAAADESGNPLRHRFAHQIHLRQKEDAIPLREPRRDFVVGDEIDLKIRFAQRAETAELRLPPPGDDPRRTRTRLLLKQAVDAVGEGVEDRNPGGFALRRQQHFAVFPEQPGEFGHGAGTRRLAAVGGGAKPELPVLERSGPPCLPQPVNHPFEPGRIALPEFEGDGLRRRRILLPEMDVAGADLKFADHAAERVGLVLPGLLKKTEERTQRGDLPPLRAFAVSGLEQLHLEGTRLIVIDAFPVVEPFVRIPHQPGEFDDVADIRTDGVFAGIALAAQVTDKRLKPGAESHLGFFLSFIAKPRFPGFHSSLSRTLPTSGQK